MTETNYGYAELALDRAILRMIRSAEPWAISYQVATQIRTLFQDDFRDEIVIHDDYKRWENAIDRLFGYVGAIAAFLAEHKLDSVLQPSGLVTYADIRQAILIVKVICPPGDEMGPRARLCKSILSDNTDFVAELRALLGRLQALPF
jgi:hypothetical protein